MSKFGVDVTALDRPYSTDIICIYMVSVNKKLVGCKYYAYWNRVLNLQFLCKFGEMTPIDF